ncbi:ester cyclase [uncultured Paludibaculum sp.]|uniref:ester cyclase n=1 Tax=uncultured Paludibaculum sp. TaxID=1765020 RepID=UPI002AAB4AF2|nr:ester cyclase [uncultured Paludibaculum sp.]
MAANTEILARFIEECWNARSRTICDELLDANYEHYMPGVEQPTVGPAAYQQMVDTFVAGFPDVRFEVVEAFGEGSNVCLVWIARATHEGVFNGIPPTMRPVAIKGVAVARIENGRITRITSMFDNAGFAAQLSAPAEKPAEAWSRTARAASQ